MNRYPRETVEFLPVTVTVDAAPVTTGIEFAVTTGTARPDDWTTPVTLDTAIGIMIEDYTPGSYQVWAQITDAPEIPVVRCGSFVVE